MLKIKLNLRSVIAIAISLCCLSIFVGLTLPSAVPAASQPVAELSFSFTRQSGPGSNQFAVWIENEEGRYMTTLFATNFTANGGWQQRETSIPLWVKRSGISGMDKTQTDGFSGATPNSGSLTYTWDGTDSRGIALPAGGYVIFLEGTLRGDNQVIYRAPIRIGGGATEAQVSVEYIGTPPGSEREMIGNVTARVLQ